MPAGLSLIGDMGAMKDKKLMLIAGAGAVLLLCVLGYAFFGPSGNDADPGSPYSTDLGDSSAANDGAADSPTRGAGANQDGSSARLGAADSSETEQAEEETATQKKKRKNRKGRKGYASDSESEEEEATKTAPMKKIRPQKKIPIGG